MEHIVQAVEQHPALIPGLQITPSKEIMAIDPPQSTPTHGTWHLSQRTNTPARPAQILDIASTLGSRLRHINLPNAGTLLITDITFDRVTPHLTDSSLLLIEAALANPATTLEIAAGLPPQHSPHRKSSTARNQSAKSRTSTNSPSSSEMEEDDKATGDQAEPPS